MENRHKYENNNNSHQTLKRRNVIFFFALHQGYQNRDLEIVCTPVHFVVSGAYFFYISYGMPVYAECNSLRIEKEKKNARKKSSHLLWWWLRISINTWISIVPAANGVTNMKMLNSFFFLFSRDSVSIWSKSMLQTQIDGGYILNNCNDLPINNNQKKLWIPIWYRSFVEVFGRQLYLSEWIRRGLSSPEFFAWHFSLSLSVFNHRSVLQEDSNHFWFLGIYVIFNFDSYKKFFFRLSLHWSWRSSCEALDERRGSHSDERKLSEENENEN